MNGVSDKDEVLRCGTAGTASYVAKHAELSHNLSLKQYVPWAFNTLVEEQLHCRNDSNEGP